MIKPVILIFSLIRVFSFFAQTEHQQWLHIQLNFGNEQLKLNTVLQLNETKTTTVNMVKFYIHAICFLKNDKVISKPDTAYYLIDASKPESLIIPINSHDKFYFDEIQLKLGVDSSMNVAGAMPGDLDPMNGMYWTWQSGYINLKLEGKSDVCKNLKKEFQFHLGGYTHPFATEQTITLKTEKPVIYFNVKTFFESIDLSTKDHLMLPGKEAKVLSEHVANCFQSVQ